MKTLSSRILGIAAGFSILLSTAAQADIHVRVPGIDVRLPEPPVPRVTVVSPPAPVFRVYDEPRHYAPPPPPRYYERRYYERRDYRDRYDDYGPRHHHHHHRHDW